MFRGKDVRGHGRFVGMTFRGEGHFVVVKDFLWGGSFVGGMISGRTFCGRMFCRLDVLLQRTLCGWTFCTSTVLLAGRAVTATELSNC
jgi:hypothetical protein